MAKLVKCKHCGARIAVTAKTCPQCGGENTPPKPAYKRLWFKILIALIVISFIQDLVNPRERTNVTANPKSEEPTSSVTSSVEIQNETVAQSVVASSETVKEDNSFMLVDGALGKYGEEVTIPSQTYGQYTYTRYLIPAGEYTVENKGGEKMATVFVVNNDNSDDVKSVLRFSKTGEKQRVTVEDGYNIQLSLETQVLFTPVE